MGTDPGRNLWDEIRRLSEVIGVRSGETPKLREGERRDVAILFLDIKDFTALSEDMDPEILYDLMTSVMKTLSDVIEAYGGYVDKIQGDSIMALFGARRADENDSTRAVTCATKMLETIGGVNGILDHMDVTIAARVGISYGTVTVAPDPSGHMTAMGDEVNLASRLEETAPDNTIQVSAQVRKQCGEIFRWEDLGLIPIRGRKKQAHVFRPLGPGSLQQTRWERAARVAKSPLVGREGEMQSLRGLWRRQMSGELGRNRLGGSRHLVMLLSGEAGIGKSRMVHEFIVELKSRGEPFKLLFGRTLSYAQQPFWLWITLLRGYFKIDLGEQDAAARLETRLRELAEASGHETLLESRPFLASLLSIPVEDPAFSSLDPETRHSETVMAVRNFVEAVARKERLLVVLEDLHWMDSASREVLDFVMTNCTTGQPVLFLCVFRPVWDTGQRLETENYENAAEVVEMKLERVPERGCRRLIGHMLETGYPVDVENFLLERSGGNPFFLEELVLDLIEGGVLEEEGGSWSFTSPPEDVYIPSTLNSLIRSRIDRLPPEYRGGLQHCSVLGMDFLMKLYRRLHEKLTGSGEPDEIVSELTRRDFLRTVGSSQDTKFIFRHFLIHDSVYDTLLHRNRRILHRYAAEAIEELFAEESGDLASLIAHHWERAGDSAKALHWGLRALETCRRTFQNDEGLKWADKLAGWLEEDPQNVDTMIDVLDKKQDTLRLLGRRDRQESTIRRITELAERSGEKRHRAMAFMLNGSFKSLEGRIDEAQEDFEKALELTAENDRAAVYCHQGDNYFRGSRYPEALECNEKVLALTDDYVLKARVELSTAFICSIMARPAEMEEHLSRAWKLIEDNAGSGLSVLRAQYFARYAGYLGDRGETDRSLEYYVRSLELFRNCGDLSGEAMVLNNMHGIYSARGDYRRSLEVMLETARIYTETGEQLGIAIAWYNIASTYMVMKQSDMARDYFHRYLDLSSRISNELGEAYGNFGLGGLYRAEGQTDRSAEHLRRAIEVFRRLGGREMETAASITLAHVLAEAGRSRQARELLDGLTADGTASSFESTMKYLEGLIMLAEADGDRDMLTAAADSICASLENADELERSDVANRNVKLAAVLEELGRSGDCSAALCRGSKLLSRMLREVDPAFIEDVIDYEDLSRFLKLCRETGCPVELPSGE
ncbi:MAG: tetratricopeptide repeat protein [Candidatus Fermentibacteraceae bacterium]|nr:tetratricopeptide repeat protein [Candidatus Fermentibacteraceae bacterium]